MEKLYYHPERTKIEDIPVFTDSYHHQIITYFLSITEVLEPQIIKDLELIIPLYTDTEVIHEKKRNKSIYSFMDSWSILDNATEDNNPHLIDLKNAIVNWGKGSIRQFCRHFPVNIT